MTDGKEEKAPRFAGIGGHHSHNSGTNDWITPQIGDTAQFEMEWAT